MGMAILPRPSKPKEALADLWSVLRERRRHQWGIMGVAVAATGVLIWMFAFQFNQKPAYRPPEIQYVEQWRADRTRADIEKRLAKDLPVEKARAEELKKLQLERQKQFQRVADMMGIDYKK
jgi:cytochrome c-type biogenesis protein CcmE